MATIVPTITTDNLEIFKQNLEQFKQFAKRIQIDASDGSFAPNVLVPLSEMELPTGVTIDLHLMTARPNDHLEQILRLKPSLCIVHVESDDNLNDFFTRLREADIKVGVALLKGTFPGKVASLISAADHAMIFAGELGRQGGSADMLQAEKVNLIRKIKTDIEIGWDGGANLSNVRALAHAGIDIINVGNAISGVADRPAMYQSLIVESEKKGVLI